MSNCNWQGKTSHKTATGRKSSLAEQEETYSSQLPFALFQNLIYTVKVLSHFSVNWYEQKITWQHRRIGSYHHQLCCCSNNGQDGSQWCDSEVFATGWLDGLCLLINENRHDGSCFGLILRPFNKSAIDEKLPTNVVVVVQITIYGFA